MAPTPEPAAAEERRGETPRREGRPPRLPARDSARLERLRTQCMVVLAVGTAAALAWWLQPVLVPVTIAWLLKIALTPVVRGARRRGVPPAVSAALLLLTGGAAVVGTAMALVEPAAEWVEGLPRDLHELQERIEKARGDGSALEKVAAEIDQISDTAKGRGKGQEPVSVQVEPSTPPMFRAFAFVQRSVAQVLLVLVLLYFMLATDRTLLAKAMSIAPDRNGRRILVRVARAVETSCARYIRTITVINLCLGTAVGLGCWATGLGQPLLWGVLAATLNFMPFVGAACGVAMVALAGITSIETLPSALYPAAVYLGLTTLEGMVITPAIVGRQIRLSPVVVLLWLVLWGWLWGLAGALLALPMLAAAVLVCRNVPEWRPLAVLAEG